MKLLSKFPGTLTLVLMLAGSISPAATKLPDTFDIPAIDRFVESMIENTGPVGLSVAIVKDGQVILTRGYGKRSLTTGEPVGADTLFAIGSVTKQFTCACLLLLAEDGKLSVQDPVAKYYPDLTRAADIRLIDLMNHTSGYPDYYPLDFVDRRMQKPIDPDELLHRYAGGKLDFEPGSRYSYSNTGYILLGRIVEKVSGESFRSFLTRRLLKPLGLNHTRYEPELSEPGLAKGYTSFALSAPEPIQPEAAGWIGAAGAIYSTAMDLAKWDLALVGGRVLKPASYELMTTPRRLSGGKISEYGCGLAVKIQGGRQVLSHNGAVAGFNASTAIIPSTGSGIVLLCNQDGGLGALPSQLLSLALKEPANVPSVNGPGALEAARTLFVELQHGKVQRQALSTDFNQFLTDDKLRGAADRLKSYGTPTKTDLLSSNERGGMEVTVARFQFPKGSLRTLMYRQPNGSVEQFFVYPD